MGYNRFTRARGLFGGVDTKQVSEVANGASGVYAQITQGSTALTGTLRGLYAVATNGTTTGTGTIRGAEIKARAADPSGNGANIDGLTGVYVSVDVKAKVGTTIRGFEVSLDGGAGGSSTLAQGLVIFNNSSAAQTTAIAVDVNGGTPTDHKAFTADFRLQNGALIDNAVSGVLAFTVAAITFSGTLNVVGNFSVNTDRFTVNATSSDLSSYNQEADATGTTWTVKKSRAAGAACSNSDVLLDIIAQGMNATPTLVTVAELKAILTDKTAGSEDGSLSFLTAVNGTLAERLSIADVVNSTVNFQVGTDKFVVTASSGATVIKSTLGAGTNGTTFTVAADGALAIATTGFTVSAAGLAVAASRMDAKGGFKGGTNLTEFVVGADGSIAVVSTMFTVSAAGAVGAKGAIGFGANLTEFTVSTAGAVVAASTVKSTGDFTVGASKFVVTAASGNTLLKGTIGAGTNGTEFTVAADGSIAVVSNKFTVSAAGVVAIASTLGVTGDLTVGSSKFIVTATTGNLATKGSIAITGTSSLTSGITVGTSSTTFGFGIPLSNAHFQGNGFFADDGGVALEAGSTENLMVRYNITQANTGGLATSASSLHASMWVRGSYTGTGGMSGVWGSFSVPTGVVITNSGGTADMAGGHFSVDIPTGATLASGSRAAGVSVGGDLSGTITGALLSGFRVRAPSAGTWTYILHADAAAAAASKHGIFIGASATVTGSGVVLNATNYQANALYAEDGGVELATGYTECFTARYLVTTAVTGGAASDVSATAIHGNMQVRASYTGMGGVSGIWGGFSVPTGVTINNSVSNIADVSGGHFSVDVPSGATLSTGSYAAGISIGGNLGGTIDGTVSGLRVRAPAPQGSAGNWTYGIDLYHMGDPTVADIRFSHALVFVCLDTAITATSTDTTTPAGSIGITSNGTGVGHLFMSDGSKWQYALVA